jgi:hypothetical protein
MLDVHVRRARGNQALEERRFDQKIDESMTENDW